jgi:tRNA-dihydrouridine synthase A
MISKNTILYTEMVMDAAIVHNPNRLEDFIGYSHCEEPLVVQLGGSDPVTLGEAAYLCESFGNFHAINLNCGCPSNKAKKAGFGAELMLEPQLVQQCVEAMMRRASSTEVTVKCRLGVTGRGDFEHLTHFVRLLSDTGVRHVIIHARHCVLKGLTPAQNRY